MNKTYKLLIDSPKYPKGTRAIQQKSPCSITGDYSNFYTLFLPEQNNYNHHSPLGKIHKEQIENRPTVWELQEDNLDLRSPEAEKMREEARSKRWEFIPKEECLYYVYDLEYITERYISKNSWAKDTIDFSYWNIGNCHRTAEEALAWGEKYARYFLTE